MKTKTPQLRLLKFSVKPATAETDEDRIQRLRRTQPDVYGHIMRFIDRTLEESDNASVRTTNRT